ncbi:MAG TPA: ATP-binding protein, partial [Spirochaetia bacterium]|nr:ATP-binding protein [Spirochaetia bacterium]
LVSRDDGLFYIPSPDTSKALAQVGDREYVRAQKDEATRGFYIAGPVLSRVTGIWGIPVSYPLTRGNAGMAILFAAIELPTLNELYESARPKPDGSITLVRQDGIILARAPFDAKEVGRNLAAERVWRDRREGFDRKVVAIDNVEKFIVLRALPDLPLEISVAQPVASALGPWRRETSLRFAILAIATAVMLVLYRRMLGNWRALTLSESNVRILNRELGDTVEEVRRQLAEKEAIIRETNHRVKNHLAQVVSLVRMTRMEESTPKMEALEARLEGYRLLYEKLSYKPGEGERLDAGDYLEDLLSRLVEVTPSDRPVTAAFHSEPLAVTTKTCSALGLMLGELVTNSIKHAGPGEGGLRIECSVRADREGLRMTYSDNGPGFDYPSVDRSSIENHIGLILVESLVKQYEGTLTYRRDPGSRFEILLKTGEPSPDAPAA